MPAEMKNLDDLFQAQLRDMYYAENKIVKALPKMQKKAADRMLAVAFRKHENETVTQIQKLERVMVSLGMKIEGERCEAIEGLLKEAENLMDEAGDVETLDAAMIVAAQKIEHYEIATYGCLCAFAKRLGYREEGEILHSILEEERKTDEGLTAIAEGNVNELSQMVHAA